MSEAFVPQGQAILNFGDDEYGSPMATLTNVEFSGSTSSIDYTNNDSPSGTSEFIPGLRELGTITADFVANSQNASYLNDAWQAKTIDTFDILFWTGGLSKSGTAFIEEFSISAELTGESVVEGSITLRIKTETN